jgi:hypothetical protein
MRCNICDFDVVTQSGLLDKYSGDNSVMDDGVCLDCFEASFMALLEFGAEEDDSEHAVNQVSRGVGEANDTSLGVSYPDTLEEDTHNEQTDTIEATLPKPVMLID